MGSRSRKVIPSSRSCERSNGAELVHHTRARAANEIFADHYVEDLRRSTPTASQRLIEIPSPRHWLLSGSIPVTCAILIQVPASLSIAQGRSSRCSVSRAATLKPYDTLRAAAVTKKERLHWDAAPAHAHHWDGGYFVKAWGDVPSWCRPTMLKDAMPSERT